MSDAARLYSDRSRRLADRLARVGPAISRAPLQEEGSLVRMIGIKLEAVGCQAPIGSRCRIVAGDGNSLEAEVVGFSDGSLFLMPEGHLRGVQLGARVVPMHTGSTVAVDEQLLGRVIDGAGNVIDRGPSLRCMHHMPLRGNSINPLHRSPIREPLDVGVRAINALLTIGRGQRLGLFAGSGVGKSTLLGMMTRHTDADVIVVALVGERGREVREFVENILGEAGLARAIVVATPADDSPLMRVHGAWRATAIAEFFRARGQHVLLLMDSLTRFAQAQREIGLAVGEPPVSKGYPPSVFSLLPTLVERAGNGTGGSGSITAIYTVLVEGDDMSDPIADAVRGILDGHIVLSRELAERGHFPAVDVLASVSRLAPDVAEEPHLRAAGFVRELLGAHREVSDLIQVGAYVQGSDPRVEMALELMPQIDAFLRQGVEETTDAAQTLARLAVLTRNSRRSA